MTVPKPLLDAIRSQPDDDQPRLALADWLDGAGDADWAALIREQCRPATYYLVLADNVNGLRKGDIVVEDNARGWGDLLRRNFVRPVPNPGRLFSTLDALSERIAAAVGMPPSWREGEERVRWGRQLQWDRGFIRVARLGQLAWLRCGPGLVRQPEWLGRIDASWLIEPHTVLSPDRRETVFAVYRMHEESGYSLGHHFLAGPIYDLLNGDNIATPSFSGITGLLDRYSRIYETRENAIAGVAEAALRWATYTHPDQNPHVGVSLDRRYSW